MSNIGPRSTAEEVSEGVDLSGKVAIVTGASSGLGVETARVLALRGAHVILAVRDVAKGEAVVKELVTGGLPASRLEVSALDLGSFASVREFAARFLASKRPLNLLINNAGIMAVPSLQLVEGYEAQFATNHLAHFLLNVSLAPALVAGAPSRVVSVSSVAHKMGSVDIDDINFEKRGYHKFLAYAQSKTANILFAREFNKRLSGKGVQAYSLHPGGIMTGLQVYLPKEEMIAFGWMDQDGKMNDRFKSVPQGASTSVYAATSPALEGKGGAYLEDNSIAVPATPENRFGGQVEYSKDDNLAARLWELSEKATGVSLAV